MLKTSIKGNKEGVPQKRSPTSKLIAEWELDHIK